MLKIGILISGRGSNMQAILQAIKAGFLDAECTIVISNKADAKGLEVAKSFGSQTAVSTDEKQILGILQGHKVDLIILAGYMRIVGKILLDAFPNKILNIHPSLLPSFKGLNAQRQALKAGVKISGCTVHYVNEKLDDGKIIFQEPVPVLDHDTEASLSKRILEKEHVIYPKAIQLYSEGKV
ncbi:phosphoribosylglycinamide formyltransferase [Candidatus Margulisiibacteriota bacterium]